MGWKCCVPGPHCIKNSPCLKLWYLRIGFREAETESSMILLHNDVPFVFGTSHSEARGSNPYLYARNTYEEGRSVRCGRRPAPGSAGNSCSEGGWGQRLQLLLLHCTHTGTHLEGQDTCFFFKRSQRIQHQYKYTLWILWFSLIKTERTLFHIILFI